MPGNLCSGGVDLGPKRYQCSGSGGVGWEMAVGLLVGIGVLAWAYRRGPQPRQGKKNEDSSNFGIIDTSDVFGG